jgi:2-hydroxychromene-2-carboxylate isomerase
MLSYREPDCSRERRTVKEIEFWFDFSSPYGYIASQKIDAIAARHGRAVRWKPWLIGALFKQLGYMPLEQQPGKKAYMLRDLPRHARAEGVALSFPSSFPEALIAAARAVYWLEEKKGVEAAGAFAKRAYVAYWAEGQKLSDAAVVARLASAFGVGEDETLAALNDPAVKDRLKRETDAAIAAGIFGSPFIVVDGEPFWGSDRLGEVERWLATGGW